MNIFACISVLVFLSSPISQLCFCQDVSLELESNVLYNIEWIGGNFQDSFTGDETNEKLTELLPNSLLGNGVWSSEAVAIRTSQNEEYTCVLPGGLGDHTNEVTYRGSTTVEHLIIE